MIDEEKDKLKLGITEEYNKKNRDTLWDSTERKAEYRDKIFGDKKTIHDPISGNILHKSQKAAQKKYHMKNSDGENISTKWANYSAEVDHIHAIKDVHDNILIKNNPFLSDEDFKEIINCDENYRILSKKYNTSKGAKNDFEMITDKDNNLSNDAKIQMAKDNIKSSIVLTGKFTERTVSNIGKEFVSGAKDTVVNSMIPLTSEAIRKAVKVAQGEENIEDALKDMGKVTVNTAVYGGANRLLIDTVNKQLLNSNNPVLINIVKSNQVSQVIAVVAIVQDSALRYINGEITGKEFVDEIGEKGAVMVAGMVGGQIGREIGSMIGAVVGTGVIPGIGTAGGYAVGAVVGQIIGTIITTVACTSIITLFNTLKSLNNYKIKESQIKKLEREALNEIENQRKKFREIVETEYKRWDKEIESGFDMILRNACEETYNLQGVTEGIDKILNLFGKNVAFKNLEEYEAQLDMPLKISF